MSSSPVPEQPRVEAEAEASDLEQRQSRLASPGFSLGIEVIVDLELAGLGLAPLGHEAVPADRTGIAYMIEQVREVLFAVGAICQRTL